MSDTASTVNGNVIAETEMVGAIGAPSQPAGYSASLYNNGDVGNGNGNGIGNGIGIGIGNGIVNGVGHPIKPSFAHASAARASTSTTTSTGSTSMKTTQAPQQIDEPPVTDGAYTTIPDFYDGRSVFITGGTGFMGKVLIEKLLRSCPKIRNIYVLIRPRKEDQAAKRLEKILNAPLFEELQKERPEQLKKVIPIDGDITEDVLGISPDDQALLCREVSVVFHSAATVKFDEKLKKSVDINMMGTKRLVALCHQMKGLRALIHVSTAYCNCDRSSVSEEIYAPPFTPENIMSLVSWMPEHTLDQLTPELIGNRPNTYTFTKALAEHMLLQEAGNLPVSIVRPSIVTASLKEPFAGWVDNHNGPTGLVSALGKGLFRSMMCEKDFVADMVPVDIVINLMIAAAWRTATTRQRQIAIYNCCTGKQHPITWAEFVKCAMCEVRKNPLEGCVWYPTGGLQMNRKINSINSFLLHTIPAYLYDKFHAITGKKSKIGSMMLIQNRIAKSVGCLEYFSTRQWKFDDSNVQSLLKTLSPKDRQTFVFDVREINWAKYVEAYVLGFRQFLFKQSPTTLPESRRRMQRLYWMHQTMKVVTIAGVLLLLTRNVQCFRDIARMVFGVFLRFIGFNL